MPLLPDGPVMLMFGFRVAFEPGDRWLMTAGEGGLTRLWDVSCLHGTESPEELLRSLSGRLALKLGAHGEIEPDFGTEPARPEPDRPKDPERTAAFREAAEREISLQKWQVAIEVATIALRGDPGDAEAAYLRGEA